MLGEATPEGPAFEVLFVCARRPFSWKSSSPPATSWNSEREDGNVVQRARDNEVSGDLPG